MRKGTALEKLIWAYGKVKGPEINPKIVSRYAQRKNYKPSSLRLIGMELGKKGAVVRDGVILIPVQGANQF